MQMTPRVTVTLVKFLAEELQLGERLTEFIIESMNTAELSMLFDNLIFLARTRQKTGPSETLERAISCSGMQWAALLKSTRGRKSGEVLSHGPAQIVVTRACAALHLRPI